ncbi:glucose/arabinose dehydrogenase [Allocatelliglobosispora scoriae]|uniref:Glucose/arabinose dehydrogenase n=1 Tax=Allocatelliglobosispora scoriae TaxID=643052 RepID=A0A841BUE3_9ACTN|nr:PQQ-dependent sugar dehydrogenase [Allocatelliglobosispora scoriae]MBB5870779.1 glucose/arabinose dehydrogenase [Allocatelliglobosispora scoriae]
MRLRRTTVLGAVTMLIASIFVTSPAQAAPTRYEAENATISLGLVEANHTGYSGTGFVNNDNVVGSYTQWTVNAATAGTATITIRYSNGSGTNRPADIAVNGSVVAAASAFNATTNFDTWANKTITAPVTPGSNTIRVTSTTANGPANFDYLDFEVATQPAFTDYQAENATISQGLVESNWAGYTGTGFVNTDNVAGSYVQWTVTAASTGTAQLTFRYAHGNGGTRPGDVAVNGNLVSNQPFPATATWDTWAEVTVSTTLTAGSNTVRVTATTATGLGNMDRLRVTGQSDSQAPTVPGAPSCSAIAENSLTLNWGASTDNVGVVGYDIYNDGNLISQSIGTGASKTLTGLNPNTEYRLSVFAKDAAGNVSLSSAQAICTTAASSDTAAPSAPTNLTFSGLSGSTVTLTWTASTDNVGVTAYDARTGTTVIKTVTGTPPAATMSVTGLACNTAYTLNVVARDAAGNVSAQSNAVTFTTSTCSGGVPSSIGQISGGWTIPWGTYFMPDGQTALVTERDDKVTGGQFKVFKVTLAGVRTQVGTVPNTVTTDGEGGLMGVAVDPNWATNHYVYFMHTASEGNRVARMTYDGSTLTGYLTILSGIAKNRYHNGGRLAFGPDGYLYVATGDGQTSSRAQDVNSLNGKILRITTTGAAAPGNPFGTRVYSYGHRNPQGLAFDSQGRLWEAEFGDTMLDELNLIKPGKNYGWPTCEGTCSVAGMENPKRQWSTSAASPSGIAIVRDVVYMAALRGQQMWRIPLLTGESTGTPTAYYTGTYGRLRTVTKVPGSDQLWLSTTNCDNNGGQANGSDRILRITIT